MRVLVSDPLAQDGVDVLSEELEVDVKTKLSEDELVRILVEPKNALIRQYQKYFDFEGARLEFTEEGLREVARVANQKDIGARGLRATLEKVMLEPMFHLPSRPKGYTYVVSPEVVRGERPLLKQRKRKGA